MLERCHLWVWDSAAISPAGLDGSGSKLNTEKMMCSWSSSPMCSLCHCPMFVPFRPSSNGWCPLGPWHSTLGKLAWEMKPSLPIVPHKAVAEISKIGNLLERWVVVTHGCQSEPTDGSTGGWISESLYFSISLSLSVSFSLCFSVSLSLYLSLSPSRSLSLSLSIYLSVCLSACLPACLPVYLSLSIYLSTYLSLSNSAKLPPKVELDRSKTKQVCETSS